MTKAAEHALRTLADKLGDAADGFPTSRKDMDVGREILTALSVAHRETADLLESERKAVEARLCRDETGVWYDPKGGKRGTR